MATRLAMRAGIRHLVVAEPDTSSLGACSVDLLATLVEARRMGATAAFFKPAVAWPPALAHLTSDVPRRSLTGLAGLWCRVQWRRASGLRSLARWRRDRVVSVRRELGRELRRHAGDERLPSAVRTRLKNAARRIGHPEPTPALAFPRRLIRERVQVSLDREARARAAAEARAAGIPLDRPLVAFELPHRVENALPAVAFLVDRGYGVVRIGDPRGGSVVAPGLVDLACGARPSPLLEFFVLQSARFLVCESVDLQHAGYLAGTPTLTLNVHDAVARYPIRADGAFTLSRAVDLDTGRVVSTAERLETAFYQNERNIGYSTNPPELVVAAVSEMHDATAGAWRESTGQAAFRAAATAAAGTLAATVAGVAGRGADAGFLGDGRLARGQADEAGR